MNSRRGRAPVYLKAQFFCFLFVLFDVVPFCDGKSFDIFSPCWGMLRMSRCVQILLKTYYSTSYLY